MARDRKFGATAVELWLLNCRVDVLCDADGKSGREKARRETTFSFKGQCVLALLCVSKILSGKATSVWRRRKIRGRMRAKRGTRVENEKGERAGRRQLGICCWGRVDVKCRGCSACLGYGEILMRRWRRRGVKGSLADRNNRGSAVSENDKIKLGYRRAQAWDAVKPQTKSWTSLPTGLDVAGVA